MKCLNILQWLPMVAVGAFFYGCQQMEDAQWSDDEYGTLKVETRTVENVEVPYPMSLYAFSSSGDCVDTQTIEDEDEKLQMDLPSGNYRIVAVAGYGSGYVLPSVEDWEDEITVAEDEIPETPLMMGMADIKIDTEVENKLKINLSYSVAAMDVALSGVPDDVKSVEVTVSPFYSSVNLKGEYQDSGSSLCLTCSLDEEGQWVSPLCYVFPGSSDETVLSIALKMKDGTKSTYGYVWKDAPQANKPYHLKGSYAEGLMLDGSFVVQGWGEAEEVKFGFGSGTQNKDENGSTSDTGDIPEIGSFWKAGLVIEVGEADETGVDVLLMSLDEWYALTSHIEELLAEYSLNGISGWRLPTHEEAKRLKDAYGGDDLDLLNDFIWAYNSKLIGLDLEERYLCTKSDVYNSFSFKDNTVIREAGAKTTYSVRLVKSFRIEF